MRKPRKTEIAGKKREAKQNPSKIQFIMQDTMGTL